MRVRVRRVKEEGAEASERVKGEGERVKGR